MSTAKDRVITGPIHKRRLKPDLQYICAELQLDTSGTVPVMVERILTFIAENEEMIAANPRFQGLVSYRHDAPVAKTAVSKETGKNSADKTVEDIAEQSKPTAPPTG